MSRIHSGAVKAFRSVVMPLFRPQLLPYTRQKCILCLVEVFPLEVPVSSILIMKASQMFVQMTLSDSFCHQIPQTSNSEDPPLPIFTSLPWTRRYSHNYELKSPSFPLLLSYEKQLSSPKERLSWPMSCSARGSCHGDRWTAAQWTIGIGKTHTRDICRCDESRSIQPVLQVSCISLKFAVFHSSINLHSIIRGTSEGWGIIIRALYREVSTEENEVLLIEHNAYQPKQRNSNNHRRHLGRTLSIWIHSRRIPVKYHFHTGTRYSRKKNSKSQPGLIGPQQTKKLTDRCIWWALAKPEATAKFFPTSVGEGTMKEAL